jgi:hypothetical protein
MNEKLQTKKENTNIHKLLCSTITKIRNEENIKLPRCYKQLEKEQHRIGWCLILYGCLSKQWSIEYNKETATTLGEEWVSQII